MAFIKNGQKIHSFQKRLLTSLLPIQPSFRLTWRRVTHVQSNHNSSYWASSRQWYTHNGLLVRLLLSNCITSSNNRWCSLQLTKLRSISYSRTNTCSSSFIYSHNIISNSNNKSLFSFTEMKSWMIRRLVGPFTRTKKAITRKSSPSQFDPRSLS